MMIGTVAASSRARARVQETTQVPVDGILYPDGGPNTAYNGGGNLYVLADQVRPEALNSTDWHGWHTQFQICVKFQWEVDSVVLWMWSDPTNQIDTPMITEVLLAGEWKPVNMVIEGTTTAGPVRVVFKWSLGVHMDGWMRLTPSPGTMLVIGELVGQFSGVPNVPFSAHVQTKQSIGSYSYSNDPAWSGTNPYPDEDGNALVDGVLPDTDYKTRGWVGWDKVEEMHITFDALSSFTVVRLYLMHWGGGMGIELPSNYKLDGIPIVPRLEHINPSPDKIPASSASLYWAHLLLESPLASGSHTISLTRNQGFYVFVGELEIWL